MIIHQLRGNGLLMQLDDLAVQMKQEIEPTAVNQLSWEAYPYRPEVLVRIAYSTTAFYIRFDVQEHNTRATVAENNGNVWEDSCVEMFISPTSDDRYYNLEFSCIGKCLLGYRKLGDKSERASAEVLNTIRTYSSLGSEPFGEVVGECAWWLIAEIPFAAFTHIPITSETGKKVAANFYKCGNLTATPHYVSWRKIFTPTPSFHQPAFFGELIFG